MEKETQIVEFLNTSHGARIAWTGAEVAGAPTIVFFAGHGSDMDGTKALAVDAWARENGFGIIRFDYSGHGRSSGAFLDGTISTWKADCLAVVDELTTGAIILVGSSLGGWLMTLVARERSSRIAGIIGIAAAPDFTDELIWNRLSPAQQDDMKTTGRIALPNPYAPEDVIYTYALIEDGRKNFVLGARIPVGGPVRLLHGMKDEEVPHVSSEKLASVFQHPDIEVILDQDAGHRFSEPDQIELILSCLDEISRYIG
ncbi:alpha/beta fold hydrolase [Alphaproteobacteria bacterium LSUCC0684]